MRAAAWENGSCREQCKATCRDGKRCEHSALILGYCLVHYDAKGYKRVALTELKKAIR